MIEEPERRERLELAGLSLRLRSLPGERGLAMASEGCCKKERERERSGVTLRFVREESDTRRGVSTLLLKTEETKTRTHNQKLRKLQGRSLFLVFEFLRTLFFSLCIDSFIHAELFKLLHHSTFAIQ